MLLAMLHVANIIVPRLAGLPRQASIILYSRVAFVQLAHVIAELLLRKPYHRLSRKFVDGAPQSTKCVCGGGIQSASTDLQPVLN